LAKLAGEDVAGDDVAGETDAADEIGCEADEEEGLSTVSATDSVVDVSQLRS
jgi:hypothetical protein